jgi:nucleoside 2-deoxyribosyltransferase
MKYVYLAGPILGCNRAEANDWRHYVAEQLRPHGIVGISPLRCEPLIGSVYTSTYDGDKKFGSAKAIGGKNFFDMRACCAAIASLPLARPGGVPSVGTLAEIGALRAMDKAVCLVTDDPFMQAHPVLNYCADWVLDSYEEAVDLMIGLLTGYNGGKNV